MKKLLTILGSLVVLLVLAIILVPIIFEDDIRSALDDAIESNINAEVYYDIDAFSLSLIKSFPDINVSMGNFGVVGKSPFEKDTLAAIGSFEVTVDIMSVITGSQIKVKEILLNQPRINVLVLEDGQANYDIAMESGEADNSAPTEESSTEDGGDVNIGIERWAIVDGQVSYVDRSSNLFTTIDGLNHEGSGDFTLSLFDLTTTTTIDAVSFGFDGVEYVSNKTVKADITLGMDLDKMSFTFKENQFSVNDFTMGADGFISMPNDQDINMDIRFGGKDISLKSLISLIPGAYQEEYLAGVTAGGEINFDGSVKGTFNETAMPAVLASLSVKDGSIAYADFNIPMENINIETNFSYPSADMTQTVFNINRFSMLVDGEKVDASLKFKNLENYTWDFGFEGNADLEKITKIIPLEGTTLRGKINAGLQSSGQMSYVEAEQYEKLPTSGTLNIDDFYFQSEDLPQGFGISSAKITFNPSKIALTQFDATSGNSDFSMSGNVTNYLAFALSENEILNGELSLTSSLLDLNEFMPEETEEVETPADTSSLEMVRIPENIDFIFTSKIEEIRYTDLKMTNFQGQIVVRDGAVTLEENTFNMLDGTFVMNGSYVTKDLDQPKYDLGFKVKELSIARAFESFETVKQYIPIAEQVTGRFSTDFKVNGLLGSDMMPLMDQMNLEGLVNIAQASLTSGKFVNKLNTFTALKSGGSGATSEKSLSVKDVLVQTAIRDGRLFVEPFDLLVNGQKATVGGSNSLDGQLDYSMLVRDIPTGAIGNALNSALNSATGGKSLISDKININLGIGGNYEDPQIKLLSTSQAGSGESASATAAFKQGLTSKVDGEKAKAEAELEAKKGEQRQKIMSEAEELAAKIRAEGKANAEKVRKEGYAAADKVIAEAGSNPIKKKVAEETAKKMRAEADKKAAAIETEANKKADTIIADAKEKAAKI